MVDSFSFIRRVSQLGTWIQTLLTGRRIGTDSFGNRYYRGGCSLKGVREKRWVLYKGEPDASKVPPEWHIWLHHTADAPIPDSQRQPWQKPHQPNKTGTAEAWLPQDFPETHTRQSAQAWKPE